MAVTIISGVVGGVDSVAKEIKTEEGKEMIAAAIYPLLQRATKPFVKANQSFLQRMNPFNENKGMKVTEEQLKQSIKEELEAIQQESSSSLRSNPHKTIEFFRNYGLEPKDGKVFISYDRDDWKEIIYQIDGELDYEPRDDLGGMMVTVPVGA